MKCSSSNIKNNSGVAAVKQNNNQRRNNFLGDNKKNRRIDTSTNTSESSSNGVSSGLGSNSMIDHEDNIDERFDRQTSGVYRLTLPNQMDIDMNQSHPSPYGHVRKLNLKAKNNKIIIPNLIMPSNPDTSSLELIDSNE